MKSLTYLSLTMGLGLAFAAHACSTGSDFSPNFDSASGATGGSPSSSSSSSSKPDNGSDGGATSAGTTKTTGKGGAPGGGITITGEVPDANCGTGEQAAELTPVYMVFLYDSSSSMGDDPDPKHEWANMASRWEPMLAGMTDFFQNSGTVGVQASITFFAAPGDQAGTCHYDYAAPTVSMKSLQAPANKTLISALTSQKPHGGTPTLPAVMGGIKYAKSLMAKAPGSKAVIVLVTDGEPYPANYLDTNGETVACAPSTAPKDFDNTIANIVEVVSDAATGDPPIPTYVIGIGDANRSSMDQIATAGGTDLVFIDTTKDPAETTATLVENLKSIRTRQINCAMKVPTKDFNPAYFNVQFKHSDGSVEEFGQSQDCSNSAKGWSFDNEKVPTQFKLCPTACANIQKDINGAIQYVQGCKTIML